MEAGASQIALPILWTVFAVAAFASALFGIIIAYHWSRFSASPFMTFCTCCAYAGGCIVLLGIMFVSVGALSI